MSHVTRRRLRRSLSYVAALSVFASLVYPVQAVAEDSQKPCVPVTVVTARGSGQGEDTNSADSGIGTEGWSGSTINKLLKHTDAYSKTFFDDPALAHSIFEKGNVDFIELDGSYQALGVTDFNLNQDGAEEGELTRSSFLDGVKTVVGTVENVAASAVRTAALIFLEKTKSSADNGTRVADNEIAAYEEKLPKGCQPKYLLIGYSQGAMALTPLAEGLAKKDKLAGVVSLGNPYFKSGALESIGGLKVGESTNQGVYASSWYKSFANAPITYWIQKDELDSSYATHLTTEWCWETDIMCDFTSANFVHSIGDDWGTHVRYMEKQHTKGAIVEHQDQVATRIIDTIARHLPYDFGTEKHTETPPPVVVDQRAPLETMFVIDTTGSMSDDINAVVAQVNSIADKLINSNPSSRIGLVEYRGPRELSGTSEPAQVRLPLTNDINLFKETLQSMSHTGGGIEYVNTGILTALKQDWTPGVSRSIIVIGDEPGDDHHLRDEVNRQLRELNKDRLLKLEENLNGMRSLATATAGGSPSHAATALLGEASVHVITNSSSAANRLRPLAEENNGKVFTYRNADIAESLLDALDEIADRPIAVVTTPNFSIAGETQYLSAKLSEVYTEGPTTMTLDLGDGRVITLDDSHTAEVTYTEPGLYQVTLMVTDGKGRQATDTGYVAVESRETFEALADALAEEILVEVEKLPIAPEPDPDPSSNSSNFSSGSSGSS